MKHINNNTGLALCVGVLLLLCVSSILRPIRFQREQARRETVVKQRLLAIRAAEERYKIIHGTYAADFRTLTAERLLADSLQYIPFTDHKRFHLEATVQLGRNGRSIPLMECSATYHDYLGDLDANAVNVLVEEASASGHFPGLKVGDISEPNANAASWE